MTAATIQLRTAPVTLCCRIIISKAEMTAGTAIGRRKYALTLSASSGSASASSSVSALSAFTVFSSVPAEVSVSSAASASASDSFSCSVFPFVSAFVLFFFIFLIRLYDLLYQRMSHHILCSQVNKADILNPSEYPFSHVKS